MQSMRFFVAAAALWLGMSITVQAATLVSTDVYSSDEAFADCAINNIGSHDVTLTAHAIQLFSGVSQTLGVIHYGQSHGQWRTFPTAAVEFSPGGQPGTGTASA